MRSKRVRFHTRAKDVVIATTILLLITALVGWVLVYDLLPDSPTHLLSDYLLGEIGGEGDNHLSFTSIERNLFADLTIFDLTYHSGEDLSITAQQTYLKGGLFNLFLSLFTPKPLLSLTIDEPSVYLRSSGKEFEGSQSIPWLLRSWVKRLQIEAFGKGGSFEANLVQGAVTLDDVDVAFTWTLANDFPSFTIQAQQVAAATPVLDLSSSTLLVNFQESGLFTFSGFDTTVNLDQHRIGTSYLSAQGEIGERMIHVQVLADQGSYQNSDLQVASPSLTFSGTYAADTLQSIHLAVPSLDVLSPTLQVEGEAIDLWVHDLSSLMLKSNRITLTHLESALTLLGLHAEVANQGSDRYHFSLELQEAQSSPYGMNVAGHTLKASGEGLYRQGALERFQLQSIADLEIQSTILMSLPLEASFSYDASERQIIGSASSSALTSNVFTDDFTFAISYERDRSNRFLNLLIEQGSALRLQAHAEDKKDNLLDFQLTGRFNHFSLGAIQPLLNEFAPYLDPYYTSDSSLTGNLFFTADSGNGKVFGLDGRISLDGSLSNLRVGRFESSAGFLFTATVQDDLVDVTSAALSAEGYRLSYRGRSHLDTTFTEGAVDLFQINENQLLASIGISGRINDLFNLNFSSPLTPELHINMSVSLTDQRLIQGSGVVDLFDMTYPFTGYVDLSLLEFEFTQEEALTLRGSALETIAIDLNASYFTLPISHTSISGRAHVTIQDRLSFLFESEQLSVHNLKVGATVYSVDTELMISSDELLIRNARFTDWTHTYSGNAHYQGSPLLALAQQKFLQPFSFDLSIFREDLPIIQTAIIGSSDHLQTMIVTNGLSLGSFVTALEGTYLDLSLLGSSDLTKTIELSGTAEIRSDTISLSTKIGSSGSDLRLYDSFARMGELTFRGDLLTIEGQTASLNGSLEHIRHLSYIDQLSHLDLFATLDLEGYENLFSLPSVLKPLSKGIGSGSLTIGEPLLFGEGGFIGGTHTFHSDGTHLSFGGTFLEGTYSYPTQTLEATLDQSFGIGATVQADLRTDSFGIKADNLYFPLPYLNRTFLKPVFAFSEGTVKGTAFLTGSKASPKVYGQLSVDSSQMTTFWVYDDIISVKNLNVSIDGNRAISPHLPFFSTNQKTGAVVQGTTLLRAQLDGLGLDHYEIIIDSGDDPIYLWIPMLGFDADAKLWAKGTFTLWGRGLQTWLSGDLTISDATLSLGVRGLPYWYTYENNSSTDFNLTTDKGVNFLYPNIVNPVIKATISEGERLSFTYDHERDEITMDGTLALRSGEIYYFQKDFFITEGSLGLHTESFGGSTSVQPTINLRAKLTDYDQSGNRVDIFLLLREASFTALNPQFESLPAKDTNEILEILGQSILPSGAYGQFNLYSVANIAAAATNVAERLGYIDVFQTSALTEAIRVSLGLDMFSLRSNIIQNILLDTLPGSTLGTTFTPLARYLNNTVIFMGKYFGREFFLQALVYLSAMEHSKIRNSFLAPDLSLNLELSLEWSNPLLTFSLFTQPNELSFIDILDTMGLSVTKRIVLR